MSARSPVNDFQRVKAGDLLVEIEDDDYKARLAQAEAAVAGAEAAIENLKAHKALQHAQIAEAESSVAATQADVERTGLEAERQRALLATTYGTPQKVEQAVADQKRLEATLARKRGRARSAAARHGGARHPGAAAARRGQGQARRRSISPRSSSAIPGSWRRSTAWSSERGVRAGQYVRAGRR